MPVSEDFLITSQIWQPRAFRLADVAADGTDDPAVHDYPPAADPLLAGPILTEFDAVTAIDAIAGDVQQGGFVAGLSIPLYPATFLDYYGADLEVRPSYANVYGPPVRVFRGYMRQVQDARAWQRDSAIFSMKSSASFLQSATFSRGIDWAAGLGHAAPVTPTEIAEHLLGTHTNLAPRSPYTVALPDLTFDRFSLNQGSVYDGLRALGDATALEGWVFCRRDDSLVVTAHPNLIGALYPTYSAPTYEITDDVLLRLDVTESPPDQAARVLLAATTSTQTTLTSEVYTAAGVGANVTAPGTLRSDSQSHLDTLAARYLAHLNRRYQVKASLTLNLNCDLGDVVTLTTEIPQRGIVWVNKRFVVRALSYHPVITIQDGVVRRTWTTDATLDEVLDVV